jgi:hypothetical protein
VLLGDAQQRGALEAGAVEHDRRVDVLGRLDARVASIGVDVLAGRRDFDELQVDLAPVDATALFVDDPEEGLEHVGGVAHRHGEAR